MDSSTSVEFVDTAKVEKAKAALRYRRMSQLKLLMHAAEVCVAVVILLSWCFGGGFSLVVHSAVDRFLRLFDLFRRPLTVFLLSNVIIVVIALLSRTSSDTEKKTEPVADATDRIYDEYVGYLSRRSTMQLSNVQSRVLEMTLDETPTENLQIVPYVAKQAEPPKPIDRTKSKVSRVRVSSGSAMTVFQEGSQRQYRRTRSTVAEGPCRQENDRVLRWSLTESGLGTARRSVDDLSNEEFNQTVESYIARTRCFLQRELVADLHVVPKESHSNSNNMAVIVRN